MTNACIGPEEPKLASCPIRQGQGGEMRMTLKALDSDLEVSGILHCRHRYLFAQALTGRRSWDFRNRHVLDVTALPESITACSASSGVGDPDGCEGQRCHQGWRAQWWWHVHNLVNGGALGWMSSCRSRSSWVYLASITHWGSQPPLNLLCRNLRLGM